MRQFSGMVVAVAIAGVAVLPPAAYSVDFQASLNYSANYDTNINRATESEDEEEEIVHRPAVITSLTHNTQNLAVGANYRISERIMQRNTGDDDTFVEGGGFLTWNFLRNRAVLDLRNQRQRTVIDSNNADTLDNRQTSDNSNANLTLDVIRSGRHTLQALGGYQTTEQDQTDTDSQRNNVGLNYEWAASSRTTFNLYATRNNVEFDNPAALNYRQERYGVGVNRSTGRLQIAASVGQAKTDTSGDQPTNTSEVGNVGLIYTLSPQTSFNVDVARDVNDGENTFALAEVPDFDDGGFDPTLIANANLNQIFVSDAISAGFQTTLGRSIVTMNVNHTELDYENSDLVRDRSVAEITVSRTLGSRTTAAFSANYGEFGGNDLMGDDEVIGVELGARYRFSRRLTMGMSAEYYQRDSSNDDTQLDGFGVILNLNYVLFE